MSGKTTRLSSQAVDAQAKALAQMLVGGGFFDVMTGEQPKVGGQPVPDDLRLSRSELAATPFSAPEDGLMKANAIGKTICTRRGEPTWFRISTKEGVPLIDGGRSQMMLKVDLLVEGQTVAIPEYTHRVVKDFE